MKFFLMFLSVMVLYPSFVFANGQEPIADVQFVEVKGTQAELIERQLIEASHEVVEGPEQKRFLDNWKQNFNFYQKAKDGYRWSSMNQGTTGRDIILDSVLLFSLSHGIEMSSGPLLVTIGASSGWPQWLLTMTGVAGGIVSVPGLDPLCMIVFATYSKSQTMRTVIRTVRIAIVRSSVFLSDTTGLTHFLKQHIERASIHEKLMEKAFLENVKIFKDHSVYEYKLKSGRRVIASATIVSQESHSAYLKRVEIKHMGSLNPKEAADLELFARQFPWNISQGIKEAKYAAAKNREYVERVYTPKVNQPKFGEIAVEFEDKAITSTAGYQSLHGRRCIDIFWYR